jgi:hypothetical protein
VLIQHSHPPALQPSFAHLFDHFEQWHDWRELTTQKTNSWHKLGLSLTPDALIRQESLDGSSFGNSVCVQQTPGNMMHKRSPEKSMFSCRSILMRNMANLGLALPLSMVIIASTASALAPNTPPTIGAPVKQIPLVSNISTWQALDNRRLVVSLDDQKNYLVTLAKQCRTLPTAAQLGVSASGNAVYAGFDYITADGERCAIQSISRISHEEKGQLTSV